MFGQTPCLPTLQEKETPRNVVQNAELGLVAAGNAGFDRDGNWRVRIGGSGDLLIEARDSGSWLRLANWTAPGS